MKNLMKFCLLILAFSLTSCDQDSDISSFDDSDSFDQTANKGATSTTSEIYQFGAAINDESEIYGYSKLVRNKNGVSAVYKTSNLIPGNAYTIWIVVINKPEECDGVPCRLNEIITEYKNLEIKADALLFKGFVADSEEMTLAGHMGENDGSTSVNSNMGLDLGIGGLWNAETAEIHFVLRDHGVAIPGVLNEQLTTFTGGCDQNQCGMKQASIHTVERS